MDLFNVKFAFKNRFWLKRSDQNSAFGLIDLSENVLRWPSQNGQAVHTTLRLTSMMLKSLSIMLQNVTMKKYLLSNKENVIIFVRLKWFSGVLELNKYRSIPRLFYFLFNLMSNTLNRFGMKDRGWTKRGDVKDVQKLSRTRGQL